MKTMKKNKNMKKSLLLLAFIINLMPYINDGDMKWTTTEAQAQYYTIEEYSLGSFGSIFVCGDYSNASTVFASIILCEFLPPGIYVDEEDDEATPEPTPTEKVLTRSEIFGSDIVQTAMASLWNTTVSGGHMYPAQNCEHGFFIFYNTSTNEFNIGKLGVGANAECGEAHVACELQLTLPDNVYVVGHFHTHPPRHGCSVPRIVGVSTDDNDNASSNGLNLPCLLYEFRATSGNELWGDHTDECVPYNYGPSTRTVYVNN
jgi:hypothetical protein